MMIIHSELLKECNSDNLSSQPKYIGAQNERKKVERLG